MSRQLLVLNLIMAAVAVLFGVKFAHDLAAPRPLPARPAARALAPGPPAAGRQADPAPRPDQRGLYNVIAARSLFNPSRTESAAAPAPSAAAVPKPFLHGVVLDATKSRAYLEDPASKKVFAYAVGDAVGGGKLEAIKADRVVIARPEGPIEVLLRDPSKPQPASPAAVPGTPGVPGSRPAVTPQPTPAAAAPTMPGAPSVQPPNPSNPFLRAIQPPQPTPAPAPPAVESPPAAHSHAPRPARSSRHSRSSAGTD